MARYEMSVQKATAAAAGLLCQLRAGSARDLEIVEIGVSAVSAVAGEVALVRPTAVGATFTSSAVGAPLDNVSGAAVAVVDTVAGTAPTIGTNYMRRFQLAAAVGAGFIWSWTRDNPLVVPVSGSVALWQLSAAAVTYDVYFAWHE